MGPRRGAGGRTGWPGRATSQRPWLEVATEASVGSTEAAGPEAEPRASHSRDYQAIDSRTGVAVAILTSTSPSPSRRAECWSQQSVIPNRPEAKTATDSAAGPAGAAGALLVLLAPMGDNRTVKYKTEGGVSQRQNKKREMK